MIAHDTHLQIGSLLFEGLDQIDLTGPFGVFTLRDAPDRDLIFVGGGAGLAPILALLRSMVLP